jgi:hypothetical protein
MQRHRAALRPERALDLLVPEVPEVKFASTVRHAPRMRSIQYAVPLGETRYVRDYWIVRRRGR